jgi:alanine racemase
MRALARIDAGAISRNTARLARAADRAALCAVVKSEGYGHGAVAAARAALDGGATWLAVAAAQEARALRAGGIEARLLVMGALDAEELEVALSADADVVAWTEDFLAMLPASARVHVKLDTGMGRLGTRDPDLATRIAEGAGARLAGLMTHFATADEPGDTFMDEQLGRFRAWVEPLRERFPQAVVHAANSAATLRDRATHFDMVRAGVALYGMDPFGTDPFAQELEPALTLVTKVLAVKDAAPGESAGYGRRFVAREPTQLATLPIGYGDGWRRALTNNADVLVRGRRFPLVGTVSMDNIAIDLGLDSGVSVGDEAVLIGAQGPERILAEEIARRLDTINYEVACALTARVVRAP